MEIGKGEFGKRKPNCELPKQSLVELIPSYYTYNTCDMQGGEI
jgi:hypothetical protein